MSQSLNPARTSFAPTTARFSRWGGVAVALLLHAAVVASAYVSWEHKLEIADESPPSVPVDLVTIADKTDIAPLIDRSVKPAPADDIKPPPQDTPVPTPPPPQTEAAPAPEPAPSPMAKPEIAPAPTVKPQTRPKPTDAKKPKSDDFAALLNALTAPAATPHNARVADRTVKGVGAMNAMTMDLIDALKNQIQQCWSPPVGAPHPEQLIVSFRIFLGPDGSVARPPQLSSDSGSGNPFLRSAEEAARRAIYTCAPYKLPADKYNTWRDITVDFDPRKMVQ